MRGGGSSSSCCCCGGIRFVSSCCHGISGGRCGGRRGRHRRRRHQCRRRLLARIGSQCIDFTIAAAAAAVIRIGDANFEHPLEDGVGTVCHRRSVVREYYCPGGGGRGDVCCLPFSKRSRWCWEIVVNALGDDNGIALAPSRGLFNVMM